MRERPANTSRLLSALTKARPHVLLGRVRPQHRTPSGAQSQVAFVIRLTPFADAAVRRGGFASKTDADRAIQRLTPCGWPNRLALPHTSRSLVANVARRRSQSMGSSWCGAPAFFQRPLLTRRLRGPFAVEHRSLQATTYDRDHFVEMEALPRTAASEELLVR